MGGTTSRRTVRYFDKNATGIRRDARAVLRIGVIHSGYFVEEVCCASSVSGASIPLSVPSSDHLFEVLGSNCCQKMVRGWYRQWYRGA